MPVPRGFLFAAAEAAIKKPGRYDLAIIYSEVEANLAGVFTKNRVKGAPVKLDIARARSGTGRAVVINSGNANACTGAGGLADAREMARTAAHALGVGEKSVYVCSTGVIGTPLPMERITPAIKRIAKNLKNSPAALRDAARAIMTTDTFPKLASKKIKIDGRQAVISAMAKGSGMIRPDMATMLCFIMTDAAVEKRFLKTLLRESAEKSFNRITVDGDTSTSDTVLIMANGLAGGPTLKSTSKDSGIFRAALDEITCALARMIARDGEGAKKLIELSVSGALTRKDALLAAFAVADSPLVKTAIAGGDANWGRIMAALGRSGARMKEEKVNISIGAVKVVAGGLGTGMDARAGAVLKRAREITITIDLDMGTGQERVLTCDLTEGYVRINADYRT